ncbi:jouberin-like isoform X2 [Physella acuta]|uniref:jouberin-like isoform X2 n=1 Tax=Physella acuta TaxID=109671 RepID=UPI0027DADBE3|nr:jouberin-like isoform X2 [Physella acuta]
MLELEGEVFPKPRKQRARSKNRSDLEMPSSDAQLRVDQILQQVVAQSTKDASATKKKKKKPKNIADDNVLESLREAKGIESLHKEKDTTILANTFDPDDNNKSGKSNKQREKQHVKNKNASNEESKQNVDQLPPLTPKKKKVKKEMAKDGTDKDLILTPEPVVETPKKTPRKKLKSPTPDASETPKKTETTAIKEPSVTVTPRKKKKDKTDSNTNEMAEEDLVNDTHLDLTKLKKKKKPKSDVEDDVKKIDQPGNETQVMLPKPKAKNKKKTIDNDLENETEDHSDKAKVKKKKKAKTEADEEEKEKLNQEEVESALEKSKPKKKKKAKASEDVEQKTEEDEEAEIKPKPRRKKKVKEEEPDKTEDENDKAEAKSAEEEEESQQEKAKKKRKPARQEKMEKSVTEETSGPPPDIEDMGEVMALMIHRTDKLKNDFHILHPVIRVHVINEETGNYIPKQHQDRAVTYHFETANEQVKTILPMMTQPFDFKERKSTIPVWEDLLVFNENFNYFIQPNPKVILLFELLDFVSMNTASRQMASQKGGEGGWHKIAWAFLKVLGKNNKVNTGNKLRLQLFVPATKTVKVPGQPEVYQWWKSGQRVPYPSTLYVTLKSIESPKEVSGGMRSMFATQKELGNMSYKDLKTMNWSGKEKTIHSGRTYTTWTRLLGQLCRVPNSLSLTLPAGKKGCFVVRFSNDGRNLACACQEGTDFPILVYEIPSGTLKGQFQGHFGIIYSLSWSKSDTQLMSASSDGTVRIWDMTKLGENQTRLLPHPGYVYTAEFHPRVDSIVVTGGYDEVVRVWDISIPEDYNVLQQEMEEHHGHINSICFDTDDGQKMYTADSVGTILIWNVFVTDQTSRKHFVRDWTKYQEIKEPELKDTPINFIKMHPSGRRLLVHARNNSIFMFDLRVQRVMQKYFGAENLKEKICSTITPCGSFVFSGSEDGKVYAWNTDTGDQVAVYTQLNYLMPATDVHYHPRDHLLAICSLGDNHPIYVYKYDPLITQAGVSSPRPMSPLETTDIEDIETARTSALKETDLLSARSKVMSKEEFETLGKARYHKAMKKLEMATMQMSQMPGMVVPESLLSPRMDTIGRSGVQSTWKMQHSSDYSLTPRTGSIPPGVLSPHAPAGSGSQLTSQLLSQKGYMRESGGDWRPGFSEVGRHGSKSPAYYGRPPQLSLSTSLGKPQFTFEGAVGKTVHKKQVLAIYDYRAQRSDELNLYKGDVVTVLYKDNDNWWMGELPDGQQGFFPANYVTEDDEVDAFRPGRAPSVSSSSGTVTAVKTKSGELRFLSGGEESDTEVKKPNKKRASVDSSRRRGSKSSLPPPAPAKDDNDSIDALLAVYESVA